MKKQPDDSENIIMRFFPKYNQNDYDIRHTDPHKEAAKNRTNKAPKKNQTVHTYNNNTTQL